VLSGDRRERLSRFVSGALRHFPDDAGLVLDDRGWTDDESVESAVREQYPWATDAHLAAVVATDPKGRFERDGDGGRIRAAYGHSVDVDLESTGGPVPGILYHGTDPRALASIREEGLRSMGRRTVHLSATLAAARSVGARHADDPVVLAVDAAALRAAGHDIDRRGAGTYTVSRVPPRFLSVVDGA
jgi:putative RNA 2'-phosphotransferase